MMDDSTSRFAHGAGALDASDRAPTSAILRRLIDTHAAPRLTLGDLLHALGDRGFSLLFLAMALPNTLPVPGPPGISTLCGIPLAVIAWQMARGDPEPRLPPWLSQRSVATQDFRRFVGKTLPYVEKVERVLRPRGDWRFSRRGERMLGFGVFILAVILALPIPLGNFLAALSVAVLSLAHLEDDRYALWVGNFIAFLMTLWLAVLAIAGVAIIELLYDWLM